MTFSLDPAQKLVALLVGLVTLATALWRVRKALRARLVEYRANAAEMTKSVAALTETVNAMGPLLADIQAELKANHGGSLRDVIVEIRNETALERVARRMLSEHASFEMRWKAGDRSDSEVVFASPACVRLTGLSRDELDDLGWLRAVAPEDRERVSRIAAVAHKHNSVLAATYTAQSVITKERTHVEHTGVPVFNYAGVVVGCVHVLRETPRVIIPESPAYDHPERPDFLTAPQRP